MLGGIAVRGNLLAVAWNAAKGHVVLVDVDAQQRVADWRLPDGPSGWSDAAGVAIDARYHVFVADPANDRVLEYAPFGRFVRSFGAPLPPYGDAARDRTGALDRPHAVAVAGEVLVVAGGEQERRRSVQRFARTGGALRPLRSRGDAEAEWGAPRGLWSDDDGLVVADTLHGVLQAFRADGTFVVAHALPGRGRPTAVARSADGGFWCVVDGALVRLDRTGRQQPLAGDLAARAADAAAVTVDDCGRVYVLDRQGDEVRRYGADGASDGWRAAATASMEPSS